MDVKELIALAKNREVTPEDIEGVKKRMVEAEAKSEARDWKPGELTKWLNRPFSSL